MMIRLSLGVLALGLGLISAAPIVGQGLSASSASTGQFRRDPARAAQNLSKFIDEIAKQNPQGAAAVRTSVNAVELFKGIDAELSKRGIDSQNFGDVMGVMWMTASRGEKGLVGDPDDATIAAVKRQMASAMTATSGVGKLSDGEKQDAADEMLLRMLFFEAASVQMRTQGTQGLAAIKTAAREMAQQTLSVDISQFDVDARGITPIKFGQGPAPRQPVASTAPSAPRIPINRAPVQNSGGGATAAQLRAAYTALPAALKSAIVVKNDYYDGYNNYALEMWMLFPGGLAAQCPNTDVAKIQLTRAWFKGQKCDVGEWRTSGTGYQFRTDTDPSWEDLIKTRPTPAGTLFEGKLRSSSGGSINGGPEGVTTSVMSAGSFTISRAGWLATSMQTSVSSSGQGVFAGGSGAKNQSRANYYISGNIITLGFPDGGIEHRYASFEVEKGVLEYVYMNDTFYFKD